MTASAVLETLRQYGTAFSAGHPAQAASYYDEPSTILAAGHTLVLPTRRDTEELFVKMLADLRARHFARAEYEQLQTRPLSKTLAIASGVAVPYQADGSELERAGVTYLLRLTPEGWRIVVLTLHDSGSVVPL